MTLEGGCLCARSRYAISGEVEWAGSCYCTDCQKESGSGHLTAVAVPAAAISFSGPTRVFQSIGGSGGNIDRIFCAECGSTLFSHPHVMGDIRIVRAGTLDDSSAVEPAMAVFCSQASAWDQPPAGIATFAQMPPVQ
ncbi:GFA family protein [Alteraurantiacibacter aestuarii]|uniref:Aldehyde-activating protein n=1 Tax=Alteraurantiacibacter aestuarii TaxID=650004 RepID=A0A844ZKC5_9SPHN|nr:GFA family protein [Alteraurantiacibacter aestuarii]MXO88014.1 aldehyde-activating protein [Alteraurantiacibacter aestuarii]